MRRATFVFSRMGVGLLAFLSTLSLRRATDRASASAATAKISIHALLAESDSLSWRVVPDQHISIHALLAESDSSAQFVGAESGYFYPRSPCGERPGIFALLRDSPVISIHALLAESDRARAAEGASARNFYPRSPCGERLVHLAQAASPGGISIHALLAESDNFLLRRHFRSIPFLSTLSLRRATHPISAPKSGV